MSKAIIDLIGLVILWLAGSFVFGWLPMMIEEKRGAE